MTNTEPSFSARQTTSDSRFRQTLSIAALVLSLGAIAFLTLMPSGQRSGGGGWACVFCSTFALADALLNLLLFVPLGISLQWLGAGALRAVGLGFVVTFAVESAQLFLVPGRDASIGDLISNTLGCGFGYLLAATVNAWILPSRARASRFSLIYSLVIVAIVFATGTLLRPSFTDAAYYGQWTPNLGHLEWYRGEVIAARIGNLPLPPHRLDSSDSVVALWSAGRPIEVRAVAGPEPRALASLFSIYDENQREILLVGPDRDDLVFRYRTRAIVAGLQQPVLRLPDVMDSLETGDTIEVHIRRDGERFCFRVNADENCGLGFTAGAGWTLLYGTTSLPLERIVFMNAAWLALLFFPVGFWMRSTLISLAAFFIAALGLVFVPAFTPLVPTQIHQWAGGGIGIVVGLLVQRAVVFLKNGERAP